MIKSASLKVVIQIQTFERFPLWSLCSTPQKQPDQHLIPSVNQSQVLVVLSSGLSPMDSFLNQVLPLWYWTRLWQVCINIIHLLPWWLREPTSTAFFEAHPQWYQLGPLNSSARSGPSLQENHNLIKNRSFANHHQLLYSSLQTLYWKFFSNRRFSKWWCEFHTNQIF